MDDLERVVKEEFAKEVNEKFKNENIKNFLLRHERLPLLTANLVKEIKKCDTIILGSNKDLESKRNVIRGIVKDFANMFCTTALNVKAKELGHNSSLSFAKKIMKL